MASKKKSKNNLQALLLTAALIYFFTYQSPMITSGNYPWLVGLSLLVGIVIWLEPRVESIDLLRLRLTLREVKKIKNELFKQFVEIISYQSAISSGNWKNRKKIINKLDLMLKELGVERRERDKTLENPRIIMKLMKDGKEKLNKQEEEKIDELINLDD